MGTSMTLGTGRYWKRESERQKEPEDGGLEPGEMERKDKGARKRRNCRNFEIQILRWMEEQSRD